MRRKKGSITDLPFIISGIFSLALIVLFVTLIVNNINTQVQDNDIFDDNAKSASTKMSSDYPGVMDGMTVLTFFLFVIVSLVLAALIPVHPVYLLFYLIEYLVLIWLGAGIANAYQAVIENPIFAVEAEQFILTTHFFRYFPFIIGVVGAVLAIVVYKVRKRLVGE